MSWRDQLQPASFRGVSFHVTAAPVSIGRRVQVHEYPLRDEPYPEDLGRKARKYTVEAFLLGTEALDQRNKLESALEQAGPGTLVHPWYGALQVQLLDARPRYASNAHYQISYTLEFVEAGERKFPSAGVDTLARVESAVERGLDAAQNDFVDTFNITGPAYLLQSAEGWVNGALDALRGVNGEVNAALAPIADIANSIDAIGNELATLILQPRTLATRLTNLTGALLGTGNDVQRALAGYRQVSNHLAGITAVPVTTPSRRQQADNQRAFINLASASANLETVRGIVLASRGRDVTRVRSLSGNALGSNTNGATGSAVSATVTNSDISPFASYQHAIAVRDELIAGLDKLAETASDDLYLAIGDTQAQLQAHFAVHGAQLQRIQQRQLIDTLPALVLSHRLYGTADYADDLVARNQLPDPNFLPAGMPLEVLAPPSSGQEED